MDDKALSDLEWHRVLGALAERCRGEAGRRLARALPFAPTPAAARVALAEAREAFGAHERGEPLPLYGLRDVAVALDRLRVGAALAPGELRDVGALLASARTLRRFLSSRRQLVPALAAACLTDPTLDQVEGALTEAFDADGLLADHASPRLRELRVEYRNVRGRVVSRLEELMRRHEAVLQDAYWTEREGRYVLPVRADAHEKVPGIVHGTSGSGATLFVEPRAVVGLGNRLKVLEGAVRGEEEAIYARLSALVAERLAEVTAADAALAHADLRDAAARLARDLELYFVDPADAPALALRSARHPLLALDGVAVVPADIAVEGGRAVVVSGPNAGGKTVALKTCGLAALMARAGLPAPCAEGSTLGWFERVLTDVGDDQSLRQNLSTFSAHVRNLAAILERADGGALVLLDEVATGTDPREGEALAVAVLGELCARGAAVVCTTHYERLKVLGAEEGGPFVNASVGFDLAAMMPTFRILWGVPGPSSALAVARRFGVPGPVLERAQAALGEGRGDFERLIARLHGEQAALERARAEADESRRRAAGLEADLAAELARVKGRETKALDEEIEALRGEVRAARETLRGAQVAARARPADPGRLREASRAVDGVAAKLALGGPLDPGAREPDAGAPPPPDELRPGARVYVPRLRTEAEVVEALSSGKFRVAAGPLKLVVAADEIRPVRAERAPPSRPAGAAAAARAPARPTRDETCDVRGLRADDAVRMAEQFLDRLVGAGKRDGLFVHGRGDAPLRHALHTHLRESHRVESFRPGDTGEGGEAVTVARLRP